MASQDMVPWAGRAPALLRLTVPPDDAGAATADRYEWQSMMATADALALLQQASGTGGLKSFEILCEHHEDWSIIVGDQTEIVSAKHRELSVGPFTTLHALAKSGGLLHLFDRWTALDETPNCRLVTTAALARECARLSEVCDVLRTDPSSVDGGVVSIVGGLSAAFAELDSSLGRGDDAQLQAAVRRFLRALSLQCEQPSRRDLPHMAESIYGAAVARALGHPTAGRAIWEAVLGLVRARMRAAGPEPGGRLPIVLGLGNRESLAPRTLGIADVNDAIRVAVANQAAYAPLERITKANRMALKMARGGCSDNAIERADALRLQYREFWRVKGGVPSTVNARTDVENQLLRVIDEATEVVSSSAGPWGSGLWKQLDSMVREEAGNGSFVGLSSDLLLGGASELAEQCSAWYTDRFDVDLDLERLQTQFGVQA